MLYNLLLIIAIYRPTFYIFRDLYKCSKFYALFDGRLEIFASQSVLEFAKKEC